jgi:hypothetical protein
METIVIIPPRAAAGGAFPDIAGLLARFSASDIEGLNDGDDVQTWEDLTGNNKDFTYGRPNESQNAVQCPHYETNVVNGHPALLFDGANNVMMTPSITGMKSVAVVAKYAPATFDNYDGLLGGESSGGNIWFMGNNASADWYNSDGPTGRVRYKDGDQQTGNQNVTGAWHVFIITATTAITDILQLGLDRSYTPRYWDGYVAEICVYDSTLGAEDIATLTDYLKTKYGIL